MDKKLLEIFNQRSKQGVWHMYIDQDEDGNMVFSIVEDKATAIDAVKFLLENDEGFREIIRAAAKELFEEFIAKHN